MLYSNTNVTYKACYNLTCKVEYESMRHFLKSSKTLLFFFKFIDLSNEISAEGWIPRKFKLIFLSMHILVYLWWGS